MTRFLGTPLRGEDFSSSSSEAFSAKVASDTQARIRIDAGGRITWGSGSAAGDVYVYRFADNVIKFVGNVAVDALFVDGIEIDTTGATLDQVLKYNGTKFAPGTNVATVEDIDDIGDVVLTTPAVGDVLRFDGGNWVNDVIPEINSLDDIAGVVITSPSAYQTLFYDGTNWINEDSSVATLVTNAEATSLAVGEVVYLFGAQGDRATVKRASNTTDVTSSKTVGIVAQTIAPNGTGPVVTQGYVFGINTSAYTPGDVLWLSSSPGQYTTTKPSAPDHLVFIGVVARANVGNGIIFVKTQNGYELDELHDVSTTSKTSGDFLKYNGSLWVNDQINLGTDTVGNYVSDVTAGTGVTVTHTPSEGSSPTIAIGQAVGTTDSPTFAGATLDGVQIGVTAANEIDTASGNLTIDSAGGTVTIDDNLTVAGNLTVNGTTVTVNSTVTTIDDPVITLGGDTAPISDDNKDRGVEFRYHTGAAPKVGFFGYDDSTGRFVMIPDATNTSEVFSGTVGDIQASTFFGALSGNASTATSLQTSRTIELTGDVTGSASFDGTANASITATIAANSVALGADTTGNYMVDVSAGTGISVSHTQAEGSTATVSLDAGLDTLTDVTITSATTNDFLKYTGSAWVNEPIDLSTDTTGSYVQSLVAGTGVTITNNSGEGATPTIAIGQAVSTTSNVTFNDVTVAGNLNVTGSTFGSATLDVDNFKITLNASVTGAPTLNGEIEVNRGTSADVRIRWNESSDLWEYTNDGSSYSRIGSALMTVSDTPPSSPYTGDLWFESDSGITFVRYDSHWIEIGASGIGAVTSDTAPSSPANGQIWFESDTSQLKIYYGGSWIQVGGSDAVNVINAINAKGDLIVGTANDTVTRLGAGTNGDVLTANSSTTSGLEWVSRAAIADDFAVASIMGAY